MQTQTLRAGRTERRPSAVAHLDLDGARHIFRAHGWKYGAVDDPLFMTGLENALNFFEANNLKATIFVIAEDLSDSRKKELLEEAVNKGHEIASHTITHRSLTSLDPSSKHKEIFDSRELIASKLNTEVKGFRAPGFEIDEEALRLLEEAGYVYDSSLFPSTQRKQELGVDRLLQMPHQIFKDRKLIELPLPRYSPLPVPFHISYSLVIGQWYFNLGLRQFRRTGAPLILLFHLTDFAEPLSVDRQCGLASRVYTLSHLSTQSKLRRCRKMIDKAAQHYEFVSTESLVSNWGAT